MCHTFRNGNRTEWSPIQSLIIRVINKIGRLHSGGPICLITSMITDPIGQQKVLLPIIINHNHYNFRENKCIPFFVKELLIPSIEKKFIHFGKSPVW